jgi:hypothetical protein
VPWTPRRGNASRARMSNVSNVPLSCKDLLT